MRKEKRNRNSIDELIMHLEISQRKSNNLLFTVHTSLFGHKVPWNQTLLSRSQMDNSPPIRLSVVKHFHAITFHETHIGFFARSVIVQCDYNSPLCMTGIDCEIENSDYSCEKEKEPNALDTQTLNVNINE